MVALAEFTVKTLAPSRHTVFPPFDISVSLLYLSHICVGCIITSFVFWLLIFLKKKYHLGTLKAKLARLRNELFVEQSGGGGGGSAEGFSVARNGDVSFFLNDIKIYSRRTMGFPFIDFSISPSNEVCPYDVLISCYPLFPLSFSTGSYRLDWVPQCKSTI